MLRVFLAEDEYEDKRISFQENNYIEKIIDDVKDDIECEISKYQATGDMDAQVNIIVSVINKTKPFVLDENDKRFY